MCYEREYLPRDKHRNNYTPLMTALMYATGMDQKMQIEEAMQHEIITVDYTSIDSLIKQDVSDLMSMFIDDAFKLMKGIGSKECLDNIVDNIKLPSGELDYSLLSFNNRQNPHEWADILATIPDRTNVDWLIESYVRGRLAQEYWTLNGAVTAYHLIIGEPGNDVVKAAVSTNAEAIAWRISAAIAEVMKVAGLDDQAGMTSDHRIKDTKNLFTYGNMLIKPTEVNKVFYNCPIAECYKVVDDILSQKYGKKAGFFKGSMYFCDVCDEHGKQAVEMFVPGFIDVQAHGRKGNPISSGGNYCNFSSIMTIDLVSGAGYDRINNAKKKAENPPPLVRFP